jgi:cytochrome c-type biogenesis protein
MSKEAPDPGGSRYWLLVTLVAVVALGGFAGYVLYPRFGLSGAVQGLGLLGLAAAAGVASFFSPCSFPLLVSLVGTHAATGDQENSRPRPALFGAALALGAAVFMLLVGVVISLGGAALFAGVTFASPAGVAIRNIVGIVLVVLGLIQAGVLSLSMHGVSRIVQPLLGGGRVRLRDESPLSRFALFGFGYVLAGFG